MNTDSAILAAEKKYRGILEEFFLDTWSETNLTSHGIDHHRRVWKYARDLLSEIPDDRPPAEPSLPDRLIIASYLHDLGMAADPGFRHGKHGVYLCRQFLVKNRLNVSDYADVLDAIENHDDKEYINSSGEFSLLSLLSVADDLDAFGYIGIYRYSEIYITRGIPGHLLGYRIRENAEKRFMNFLALFGYNAEMAERHRKRFLILDRFFDSYNQESDARNPGNHEASGYTGVIRIISDMIKDNTSLNELLSGPGRFSKDPVISGFMKGFGRELREFRHLT